MVSHVRLLLLSVGLVEAHRSLPEGITCGSQFNATGMFTILPRLILTFFSNTHMFKCVISAIEYSKPENFVGFLPYTHL